MDQELFSVLQALFEVILMPLYEVDTIIILIFDQESKA